MENQKQVKPEIWFLLKKIPSLMFGLALYSVGILLTLYSDLGMSPWDVFHMGIVNHSSLTLGQVAVLTGFVILAISFFIGVIPGLGSVLNMVFIGVFIDLFDSFKIVGTPTALWEKVLMLGGGILVIGWATFFYLRVNLGAGPRDSLMEGLIRKLNKPVWLIRGIIEGMALLLGYLLGGPVGIGTLIIAASLGFSIQLAFKIGGYSSQEGQHINLFDLYKSIRSEKSGISG